MLVFSFVFLLLFSGPNVLSSEDLLACNKAQMKGFKVFLESQVELISDTINNNSIEDCEQAAYEGLKKDIEFTLSNDYWASIFRAEYCSSTLNYCNNISLDISSDKHIIKRFHVSVCPNWTAILFVEPWECASIFDL